jgi:hypothetical protein
MSYYTAGVDYRFSDSNGVASFGDDEIGRQLASGASNRNVEYVYSPLLRSGGRLADEKPDTDDAHKLFTAYWTLNKGEIRFNDNTKKPELWFAALYHLTKMSTDIIKKQGAYYPYNKMVGVGQVAGVLGPFVDREWDAFFRQYGNTLISVEYFEQWLCFKGAIWDARHRKTQRRNGQLTFGDLRQYVNEAR